MEEKNAPEMHRKTRAGESKLDARYWMQGNRLALHDSADYSIQIQHKGQREWFPLGTPNRRNAASKAVEIYAFVRGNGMEAAKQQFKPKKAPSVTCPTVGDLISAVSRLSSAREETLDAYFKAFRLIVSQIKGINTEGKFNAKGGGSAEWRKRVNAVRLDEVTPLEVLEWKNARLKSCGDDALAKRSATVTVNTLIRNSKSLFGKKVMPFLSEAIALPPVLPFDGIALEKAPSMRYQSVIDAFAILAKAKRDLHGKDDEAFVVMILALVCGLRRKEIDNALWRSMDFPNSRLRIEPTEYYGLKSEDSAGVIDLDADTLRILREHRTKHPTAEFIINSPFLPSNKLKSRRYRCDAIFKRVLKWLRDNGVAGRKPIHTMRKEIGSIIASEHGIYETSRYLRHSDIRITAAVYTDKKKIITPKTFDGILRSGPSGD